MLRRAAAILALVLLALAVAHWWAGEWLTGQMVRERATAGSGPYQGASTCSACHPQQYAEWRASLHSRAGTIEYSSMHFGLVRSAACRSCHGEPGGEGVACETCHGPGHTAATRFGGEPICLRCHAMENPATGFPVLATGIEWRHSRARRDGKDCVACHMPLAAEPKRRHLHRFAGNVAHPELYAGKVTIEALALTSAHLRVVIANRIEGHRSPTGCPYKYIRLAITGRSGSGDRVHTEEELFERRVDALMTREVRDSRLQAGEVRELRIALPAWVERVDAVLELYPSEMFGPGRGQVILLDQKHATRESSPGGAG
jgi:hypothetical protein